MIDNDNNTIAHMCKVCYHWRIEGGGQGALPPPPKFG